MCIRDRVPAGYHDSNSYPARGPGSNHAGHLHEAFQKTGQKDHRITPKKAYLFIRAMRPCPNTTDLLYRYMVYDIS